MWNFKNKKGFLIGLVVGIGVSQLFTMISVDFTQPGSISTKDKSTQEIMMSDRNNTETTGAVEELPKSNIIPLTDNSGEKNVGSEEVIPLDPEFTLHQKKGSWGWHHQTGEEAKQDILANQSVCKKPLEHCCLEQGRQQVVKVDDYEALWKLKNTDDESLQPGITDLPYSISTYSLCILFV